MNRRKMTPLSRLTLLFSLAFTLWLANLVISITILDEWSLRGTAGDAFGAVNALFSGLGLAGIVYAILLQRDDLAVQQIELRLARESQEDTRRLNQEQADALRLSAELSATSALLSFYLQEREKALSRSQQAIADSVQGKINEMARFMEKKLLDQGLNLQKHTKTTDQL